MISQASVSTKTDLELLLTDQTIEKTIDESIVFPNLDKPSEMVWNDVTIHWICDL